MKRKLAIALALGAFTTSVANASNISTPRSVDDTNPAGAVQTYQPFRSSVAVAPELFPVSVNEAAPSEFASEAAAEAISSPTRNAATPLAVDDATPWLNRS